MRACDVTMPQAVLATINPPAIFRTGSEIPKKYSTKRPKNRNVTRMTNTQGPVFTAVFRRSRVVQEDVMLKKIGMPPKGSTIGNNARNVAAAECGRVRRNCPRAWVAFMRLVKLYRRTMTPFRTFGQNEVEAWTTKEQLFDPGSSRFLLLRRRSELGNGFLLFCRILLLGFHLSIIGDGLDYR